MKGLFAIDWQPDGLATLRSVSNSRYVTARLNGSLQANVDQSAVGDREHFTLILANRPRLFIKCDHGFVGLKSSASLARAECNRAFSDPVTLVPVRHVLKDTDQSAAAAYYLKGNCLYIVTRSDAVAMLEGIGLVIHRSRVRVLVGHHCVVVLASCLHPRASVTYQAV